MADFYCHRVKLIVELDGSIHNSSEAKSSDAKRQANLESWGYKVIRFSNEQLSQSINIVLEEIEIEVEELLTQLKT